MTLGWPVAADYDEAIQNPHLNLDDRELKAGEPEYDQYGSPAVRSGNFASVYMIKTEKRKIAVRCFLREIPDQQERYIAISKDLLGLGLPYTVNFEFLPKGIKVQGNWFPILKMDWCDGELLDQYIERNLDNQVKLRRLADKWYEMSVALRKEGIAHGDLQHGNVMVLGDELKLIDYDGMFVPRLAGRRSNERGLEHYQHPGRTDEHFGRYLDNFSHWVLYTTLVALGEDKTLWHLANLADKHLIFSKNDLEQPSASKTFDVLKRHDDKTIRTYATTVENLLGYDVEKIPDFSPDKPVLFPAEYKDASKPKKAVSTGGDKGGLYKIGDTGGPPPERDKGHLFVSAQDEGKPDVSLTRYGRQLETHHIIGIAVAAIAGIIGFTVYMLYAPPNNKVAVNSDDPVHMLQLGVSDFNRKEYKDALEKFKSVSATASDAKVRSNAFALMAFTYLEKASGARDKSELNQAIANFDEALLADKENAPALYGRGRAYHILGKKSQAQTDFQNLEKMDPHYTAKVDRIPADE